MEVHPGRVNRGCLTIVLSGSLISRRPEPQWGVQAGPQATVCIDSAGLTAQSGSGCGRVGTPAS